MALPMLDGRFDAAAYRKVESLQDYVWVDLAAQRIEVFRRDLENRWVLYDYGPEDQAELASLGLHLPVEALLEDTREDFAAQTPTATAQP